MSKLHLPDHLAGSALIEHMIENKATLINQKKAAIKHADGMGLTLYSIPTADHAPTVKAAGTAKEIEQGVIKRRLIINTTGILDSHGDVHVKGSWNKTVKENRNMLHVQEHQSNRFDKIISDGDDLKATVWNVSWKDLGYDFEGKTDALCFHSTIRKERNPAMFNEYAMGRVKNHSVGMRYVKMELCISEDTYKSSEENDNWNKYIDQVVNRKEADAIGYFWAVLEAKAIEGSAVPIGANTFTPTIKDIEPPLGTQQTAAADKGTAPEYHLFNA